MGGELLRRLGRASDVDQEVAGDQQAILAAVELGVAHLEEALVAVSFAPGVARDSIDIRRFVEMVHACRAIRRQGAAALNLCCVAAGRLDAYIAANLKPWDAAAGALIIREAGGLITSLEGGEFDLWVPTLTAAATSDLHVKLLEILSHVE